MIKREKSILYKSKYIVWLSIIIFISMTTVTIYAYFTHKASVTNNMNLGYNKILLEEKYDPPLNMEKGISFVKEPYVTNIGNVDCYIRIKSVVSDSRIAQYLTMDYNNEDYSYNAEDGYWYYKYALKPGEKSKSLFTTVTVAQDADDIVLDGFDIYVYAESVQTEDGKSSEEMWNYFKNK